MDVFSIRDQLVADYADYVRSFINIRDDQICSYVDGVLDAGALWPEPLIQINPAFEPGDPIPQLIDEGILH